MCNCTEHSLCKVCHGRLSVYKYMMTEWEKSHPKPNGIGMDEFNNWRQAWIRASAEYKMRTGVLSF